MRQRDRAMVLVVRAAGVPPQRHHPNGPPPLLSSMLWDKIEHVVTVPEPRGSKPGLRIDDRDDLSGILHVPLHGIEFNDSSQELGFGHGRTCMARLRRWRGDGMRVRLREALRDLMPSYPIIDWERANDAAEARERRRPASGRFGKHPPADPACSWIRIRDCCPSRRSDFPLSTDEVGRHGLLALGTMEAHHVSGGKCSRSEAILRAAMAILQLGWQRMAAVPTLSTHRVLTRAGHGGAALGNGMLIDPMVRRMPPSRAMGFRRPKAVLLLVWPSVETA